MTETWKTLLASKRFIVITLTVLVCAAFVVAGRMPVSQFLDTLKVLGGLLASLYGVENVAQALKGPPDGPTAPPGDHP